MSAVLEQGLHQLVNNLRSSMPQRSSVRSALRALVEAQTALEDLNDFRKALDSAFDGQYERDDRRGYGLVYQIAGSEGKSYVGKTTNLVVRLISHFATGEETSGDVIDDVLAADKVPTFHIVQDWVPQEDLDRVEDEVMLRIWKDNPNGLMNKQVPVEIKEYRILHPLIRTQRSYVDRTAFDGWVQVTNNGRQAFVQTKQPLSALAPLILSQLRAEPPFPAAPICELMVGASEMSDGPVVNMNDLSFPSL